MVNFYLVTTIILFTTWQTIQVQSRSKNTIRKRYIPEISEDRSNTNSSNTDVNRAKWDQHGRNKADSSNAYWNMDVDRVSKGRRIRTKGDQKGRNKADSSKSNWNMDVNRELNAEDCSDASKGYTFGCFDCTESLAWDTCTRCEECADCEGCQEKINYAKNPPVEDSNGSVQLNHKLYLIVTTIWICLFG